MHGLILAADFWSKENLLELWNTIAKWCMGMGKNILVSLLVLIIGNKLIKWIVKLLDKSLEKTKIEPMVVKFLNSIIKVALYLLVAIVIIGILGIPTTSFIAALSAAGLTLGLALQGSLSNFAGGVLILLFKPFTIGDYIKEDSHGNEGSVTGIDLFYTKILTIDNRAITIPNGTLANTSLTNFTALKKRRIDLTVGISYSSDIKLAKNVLESIMRECQGVLQSEDIVVYVDELADSQVTIGTRCWVNTSDYWTVRWKLIEDYKLALDANGIEIPFNQLSVTINEKKN